MALTQDSGEEKLREAGLAWSWSSLHGARLSRGALPSSEQGWTELDEILLWYKGRPGPLGSYSSKLGSEEEDTVRDDNG